MTSELYRKLVITKSAICLMRAVKLDALEGILGKTSLKHFFYDFSFMFKNALFVKHYEDV